MRGVIGERALGVAVVIFAAAVALAIWFLASRPPKVERNTITSPIVSSPLTPLQRHKAKHSGAARSPDSSTPRQGGASTPSSPVRGAAQTTPQRRAVSPQGPKATTGTPKRRTGAQGPQQPTQTTPAQPSQPQPLVTVKVPVPAGACVQGVGGVNC